MSNAMQKSITLTRLASGVRRQDFDVIFGPILRF